MRATCSALEEFQNLHDQEGSFEKAQSGKLKAFFDIRQVVLTLLVTLFVLFKELHNIIDNYGIEIVKEHSIYLNNLKNIAQNLILIQVLLLNFFLLPCTFLAFNELCRVFNHKRHELCGEMRQRNF